MLVSSSIPRRRLVLTTTPRLLLAGQAQSVTYAGFELDCLEDHRLLLRVVRLFRTFDHQRRGTRHPPRPQMAVAHAHSPYVRKARKPIHSSALDAGRGSYPRSLSHTHRVAWFHHVAGTLDPFDFVTMVAPRLEHALAK